jgi:hypothetical protein
MWSNKQMDSRIDRRQQRHYKTLILLLLNVLLVTYLGACSRLILAPAIDQPGPAPTVFAGFSSAGQDGDGVGLSLTTPEAADLFSSTTTDDATGLLSMQVSSTPTSVEQSVSTEIVNVDHSTPSPTLTEPPAQGNATERTPIPTLSPETQTLQPEDDLLSSHSQYWHKYIYVDAFLPGWKAYDSWNTYYSLGEQSNVHRGRYSIQVKPVHDYGGMFINVGEWKDQEPLLRKDVAGVSFWINPGNRPLDPDDLAVTVIGSNRYPYWVKGDESVEIDYDERFFSETRLSLLGFNHELGENTWYQVIVWLDDLPFDPEYEYLTGFYIKNDAGFNNTYYLDDVSLIVYSK